MATLASIAIVLAVCATAATVIVASDATRQHAAHGGVQRDTPSYAVAREQLYQVQTLRAVVDSMVARLGPLPAADPVDVAVMSRLWQLEDREASTTAAAVWIPVPDSLLPLDGPSIDRARLVRTLRRVRADSALDTTEFNRAADDTLTRWTARWRQHARSAPLPPFWGYRAGLPGVGSSFDLPTRNATGLVALAQLNELAGWSDLLADRLDGALARGLENMSASRHYLDSPLMIDLTAGLAMAASGAELVARVAGRTGVEALAAQAVEVLRISSTRGSSFQALREEAVRDAADPDAPVMLELFDDEKLPFAVRVEILYAAIGGACRSTREVLFGFAPEREATLQALATKWHNDPALGPALALMPAAARRAREAPESLLPPEQWPTRGVLDVLLPEPTAARAVACQQQF